MQGRDRLQGDGQEGSTLHIPAPFEERNKHIGAGDEPNLLGSSGARTNCLVGHSPTHSLSFSASFLQCREKEYPLCYIDNLIRSLAGSKEAKAPVKFPQTMLDYL